MATLSGDLTLMTLAPPVVRVRSPPAQTATELAKPNTINAAIQTVLFIKFPLERIK
jgi:hypothetical protein